MQKHLLVLANTRRAHSRLRTGFHVSRSIDQHLWSSKRANTSASLAASTGSRPNAEPSAAFNQNDADGSRRTSSIVGSSCSCRSPVIAAAPRQFGLLNQRRGRDVLLSEIEPMIRSLAEKVWSASRKESRIPHTVVLKLKTGDFNILTRSHTPGSPPSSCEELTTIALALRERVKLGPQQRFRLVGIGLSNFHEPEDGFSQQSLFGECDVQDCPKSRQ